MGDNVRQAVPCGRKVAALTDIGRVVYDHTQRIISEIEDADFEASKLQSELSGVLRASLPIDFGVSWLGQLGAGFGIVHPHIQLIIEINNRWGDLSQEPYSEWRGKSPSAGWDWASCRT